MIKNILPIIELYPCIQGEGSRRGYPTIAVRTTGCTHRCYFGESGGWCDTWYSSIHPIKGRYTFSDVENIYKNNPHIKEMMITGGSPTMHFELVNNLVTFANDNNIFVTLETEGSHKFITNHKIDLISLSPKFNNSVPTLGIKTPNGKIVDDRFIDQHNKYRCNYEVIKQLITEHKDYQIKPVIDGSIDNLNEILDMCKTLNVPHNKVFLMPAGATRDVMIQQYPIVLDIALKYGFCFSGRDHIIAYDDKIGV